MNSLHKRLMGSSEWYRRWHMSKENNILTWLLFVMVALTATVLMSTSIMYA
jgi:hypothetical protein